MDGFSFNLLLAAAGLAVAHTALGPDHTLPFIVLAHARRWSRRRTLLVTAACGGGHVASSLVLGGVGLWLGYGVGQVASWDEWRGGLAAWALIAFGLAYAAWGLRHAIRGWAGLQLHEHDGEAHVHAHGHRLHDHAHAPGSQTTFWTLFVVFVLGPCEPLIPLFVLPASRGRWDVALLVAAVFSLLTLVTMLVLVWIGLAGVGRLPLGRLARWSHVMAGTVIAATGLAVVFLGL